MDEIIQEIESENRRLRYVCILLGVCLAIFGVVLFLDAIFGSGEILQGITGAIFVVLGGGFTVDTFREKAS